MRAKFIYEKFYEQDRDPMYDMGIGKIYEIKNKSAFIRARVARAKNSAENKYLFLK